MIGIYYLVNEGHEMRHVAEIKKKTTHREESIQPAGFLTVKIERTYFERLFVTADNFIYS